MLGHLCLVVAVCILDVAESACSFSCRVLASGVGRALCLLHVDLLLFVLSLCFLISVCVLLVFLYFSHLCSCVDPALLGLSKFVSVTVFLSMKNVS